MNELASPNPGNRDKNLVTRWYECVCGYFRRGEGGLMCGKLRVGKGLRSWVPLATFNRDKNLIKAPRAGLSGFLWVRGAVTTNHEKYRADPQIGFALGRM